MRNKFVDIIKSMAPKKGKSLKDISYEAIFWVDDDIYNSKKREKAINSTLGIEDKELDEWLSQRRPRPK